jgi:hypothetical protein
MLTEAVITIGSSSEQSVSRLQNIEKSIEGTQAVEDIQILKLRLKECRDAVHEEAQWQKRDGQDALVTLPQELDNSRERMLRGGDAGPPLQFAIVLQEIEERAGLCFGSGSVSGCRTDW